jgi:hypothetical protein
MRIAACLLFPFCHVRTLYNCIMHAACDRLVNSYVAIELATWPSLQQQQQRREPGRLSLSIHAWTVDQTYGSPCVKPRYSRMVLIWIWCKLNIVVDDDDDGNFALLQESEDKKYKRRSLKKRQP